MVGLYKLTSDDSIIEITKPNKGKVLLWKYVQSKTKQDLKFYINEEDFQTILNKKTAIKYEGEIQKQDL